MIYLFPSGGLGNQMFMIASTFALAKTFARRWYVDLHMHSKIQGNYISTYKDNLFWQVPFSSTERVGIIKEQVKQGRLAKVILADYPNRHSYYNLDYQDRSKLWVIMDSTMLSYRYFDNYRDDILKLFSFEPNSTAEQDFKQSCAEYLGHLPQEYSLEDPQNTQIVAVHARRGDYLEHPETYRILDRQYYRQAVEKVKHFPNLRFLIFSDDPDWLFNEIHDLAKELIAAEPRVELANGNSLVRNINIRTVSSQLPDYITLKLMSECDHLIVANSTFSWWGAYLNQNPTGILVAPEVWFNNGTPNQDLLFPRLTLL